MSPSTEPLSVTLGPVIESLRAGLGDNLVAVVLFGSRARGEAGPESDWEGEWVWLWRDQPRHQWRIEWQQI
jgi:ketosteroid isomerase-like protein